MQRALLEKRKKNGKLTGRKRRVKTRNGLVGGRRNFEIGKKKND